MLTRHPAFSFAIAATLFCSQTFAIDIGNCDEQTKKLSKGSLVLRSEQKHCVTVMKLVAMQSNSIKNMLQDLGGETNTPIPLPMDDQTLVEVADILVEIYGHKLDKKTHIIKSKLPEETAHQLLQTILAANFLDIELLLNIGVDEFAHRIFVTDLAKLKGYSESGYAMYKKLHFTKLPKDLVQLMIARNLRSIDRVFVSHTKDRRRDAINALDLATAQIVAYVEKYQVSSAKGLPSHLLKELQGRKLTDKIFFGPWPNFAIWPAHCPLPGNANYDMYASGPKPDERYIDNKDGTVTDRCTNLTWDQSSSEGNWADAKTDCAKLDKGNSADWRLPNTVELQTIVDYTKPFPTINSTVFPNTPGQRFWSATWEIDTRSSAWSVSFWDGGVGGNYDKGSILVRCVLGREWQTQGLSESGIVHYTTGADSVIDNFTGLEWQRKTSMDAGSQKTMQEDCIKLVLDGKKDWHVPTVEELSTLLDRSKREPAVDGIAFPNSPPRSSFWTSSPVGQTDHAWGVYFSTGTLFKETVSDLNQVRCVR